MNTPTYRVVHFTPNPFAGDRIAIAALVEFAGQSRVARASHLPGPECLGRSGAMATMEMILEVLDATPVASELSAAIGPYAAIDVPRPVPSFVSNPVAWVQQHVLPRHDEPDEEGDVLLVSREPQRSTEGFGFLRGLHVAGHVKKHFKPREQWKGATEEQVAGLGPISHYTAGRGLLLMEPIATERDGFVADLNRVSGSFMAYRYALENLLHDAKPKLVVYVLPGGLEDRRQGALRTLRDKAHVAIDCRNEADKTVLANLIQRAGGDLFAS